MYSSPWSSYAEDSHLKAFNTLVTVLLLIGNCSCSEQAFRDDNFVTITSANQEEHHFAVTMDQDARLKNCVNVEIHAPNNGRNKSLYAFSSVSIRKYDKLLLRISPHSTVSSDDQKTRFMVDKDQIRYLSVTLHYRVPRNVGGQEPEEYIYTVDLRSYAPAAK